MTEQNQISLGEIKNASNIFDNLIFSRILSTLELDLFNNDEINTIFNLMKQKFEDSDESNSNESDKTEDKLTKCNERKKLEKMTQELKKANEKIEKLTQLGNLNKALGNDVQKYTNEIEELKKNNVDLNNRISTTKSDRQKVYKYFIDIIGLLYKQLNVSKPNEKQKDDYLLSKLNYIEELLLELCNIFKVKLD